MLKKETTVGIFVLITLSTFIFMSYKLGLFKFDKSNYIEYLAYLKNATGINKKADVKVAGFKVGWVDSLDLSKSGPYVEAKLMISKEYVFNEDAQIFIRQDGLLGTKFIDIIPGSPFKPILKSGGIISDLTTVQPSLDDVLINFADVVQVVSDLTKVVKNSLADENSLKSMTSDLQDTLAEIKQKMPIVLNNLERTTAKLNEGILDKASHDLETVKNSVEDVSSKLKTEFLPKISNDAEVLVKNFNATSESVKNVADKINNFTNQLEGQKFFSKISTESKTSFFTNLISKADRLLYWIDCISGIRIGLDNNYEFFFNHDHKKNFKSLFNFWIHPSDNYFFIGGLNFSKAGFVKNSTKVVVDDQNSVKYIHTSKIKENAFALNLQAGIYCKNVIFRGGLFESTPGFAIDYLMPFGGNRFKWVTTFEAYDFTGKNKIQDLKYNPHLKWMNRLYFSPNFYVSFGVDDFVNKDRRYGFLGIGFNFGGTYFKNLFG